MGVGFSIAYRLCLHGEMVQQGDVFRCTHKVKVEFDVP